MRGQTDLLATIDALRALGLLLRARQGRQQQRRQNRNDGDHYQQLNQGKRPFAPSPIILRLFHSSRTVGPRSPGNPKCPPERHYSPSLYHATWASAIPRSVKAPPWAYLGSTTNP